MENNILKYSCEGACTVHIDLKKLPDITEPEKQYFIKILENDMNVYNMIGDLDHYINQKMIDAKKDLRISELKNSPEVQEYLKLTK